MKQSLSAKKKHHVNLYLIPIILVLGFVPLLVHGYTYDIGYEDLDWFPSYQTQSIDFFLAYKMYAIIILAIVMVILLIGTLCNRREISFSFEPALLLLIAYELFVILSACTSEYRSYAFRGNYEMFESAWVVLAYGIIFYYTYHFVQTEEQLGTTLRVSCIGFFLVSLIGVFQFFKLDLFRSDFGKKLILDPSVWDQADSLDFTFQPGQVYTTLYNVDYLSFYYGMLIPLGIALCIAAKNTKARIAYLVLTAMFALCLIGSTASSGILALIAALIIGFYILLSRKKKPFLIGIGVGAAVLVIGLCVLFGTSLGNSVRVRIFGSHNYMGDASVSKIATNDNDVTFTVNGNPLVIAYSYDEETGYISVICSDGSGNPLPLMLAEDGSTFVLDDERYGECTLAAISMDETVLLDVYIDGHDWYFTNQYNNTYYYYNSVGKLVKIKEHEYYQVFYDDALSGRGEIWNHTFTIIANHILLGSGANTYALVYPNDDYLMNVYSNSENMFDVKAHSWYLMQMVETGLIGTLFLIVFLGWYVVRSIKIYRRVDLHQPAAIVGFGLFVGILAYLITALANDSTVCTSPVFWVLMGLAMSVNRLLDRKAPA